MTVQAKFAALSDDLNAIFAERETSVENALVALLSRQNSLAVGLPGIAKSAMIETLASRLTGVDFWSTTCDPCDPKDAILGPLDVKTFTESAVYRHNHEGTLVTANVGFLDEICQISPEAAKSLAGLLNPDERRVFSEGQAVESPLTTVFAAANAWLLDCGRGDELLKIHDRFVLREEVMDLQSIEAILAVTDGHGAAETTGATVSLADLGKAHREVAAIPYGEEFLESRGGLIQDLRAAGVRVSTRTWAQVWGDLHGGKPRTSVLRAAAYLRGGSEVTTEDLWILRSCLWNDADERRSVREAILAHADPVIVSAETILANVRAAMARVGNSWELDTIRGGARQVEEQAQLLKALRDSSTRRRAQREANRAGRQLKARQARAEARPRS